MLTNAPWLNYNPLDIINFASKGAQLGIERGGQATQAAEAADRLRLGYAQIAAENDRHAAANALERERIQAANAMRLAELDKTEAWHNAEIGQRRDAMGTLNDYRNGMLRSRDLRDQLAAARAAEVPEPEVKEYKLPDGRVIPYLIDKKTGRPTWAPSGSLSGPKEGTLSQQEHAQLDYYRKSLEGLQKKYADPDIASNLKLQDPNGYAADMAQMKKLDEAIRGIVFKSATEALTPPPDQFAPNGYVPTSGDPRMFKPAPYAYPAQGPAGATIDPTDPAGLFQDR